MEWTQQYPIPKAMHSDRDPMFDLPRIPVQVVVELGSRSGHWAYRACRAFPNAQVFCIDPWEDTGELYPRWPRANDFREWEANLVQFRKRCHAIHATSHEAAKDFNRPIDLLFLDGCHETENVTQDLEEWVPKMSPGGLVVGHDWGGKRWGPRVRKGVLAYWRRHEFNVGKIYGHGGLCYWRYV